MEPWLRAVPFTDWGFILEAVSVDKLGGMSMGDGRLLQNQNGCGWRTLFVYHHRGASSFELSY